MPQRLAALFTFSVIALLFVEETSAYYHPQMGRFVSRDPAVVSSTDAQFGGSSHATSPDEHSILVSPPRRDVSVPAYVAGMNLYHYVGCNPTVRRDPTGLVSEEDWNKQCCETAERRGLNPNNDHAGIICCYGTTVICIWGPPDYGNARANEIIKGCAIEHEKDHFDVTAGCPNTCGVTRPLPMPGTDIDMEECGAYKVELDCVLKGITTCKGDRSCQSALIRYYNVTKSFARKRFGCKNL